MFHFYTTLDILHKKPLTILFHFMCAILLMLCTSGFLICEKGVKGKEL